VLSAGEGVGKINFSGWTGHEPAICLQIHDFFHFLPYFPIFSVNTLMFPAPGDHGTMSLIYATAYMVICIIYRDFLFSTTIYGQILKIVVMLLVCARCPL
jgi:hypothetical protein